MGVWGAQPPKENMDDKLRALERRWHQSDDRAAGVAYLRGLLRRGDLPAAASPLVEAWANQGQDARWVELASWLSHPLARRIAVDVVGEAAYRGDLPLVALVSGEPEAPPGAFADWIRGLEAWGPQPLQRALLVGAETWRTELEAQAPTEEEYDHDYDDYLREEALERTAGMAAAVGRWLDEGWPAQAEAVKGYADRSRASDEWDRYGEMPLTLVAAADAALTAGLQGDDPVVDRWLHLLEWRPGPLPLLRDAIRDEVSAWALGHVAGWTG
jgi:hypothetical protein